MRLSKTNVVLLIVQLSAFRCGFAEDNLIKNPGFEEGLRAWTVQGPRKGEGDRKVDVSVDRQVRHSGNGSVRLTLNFDQNAQFYTPTQTVAVFADTEYLLSACIKTALASNAIHLEVQDDRGWKMLSKGSAPLSGQTDWTKVEVPFRTSLTTAAIRIGPRHIGRLGDKQPMKGNVWLDDVVLVEKKTGRPRLSAKELETAIQNSRLITLENGAVKIAFAEPRLRIRSVEFKKRPALQLSPGLRPETPLYQIRVRGPDGRSEEILSLDAQSVSVKTRPGEQGRSCVIEAAHAGAIAKVSVHVALDEGGFVDMRLEPGQPMPGWTISEIVFPQMVTRGLLSDEPKDTFVGGEKPVSLGTGWHFQNGMYPMNPRVPVLYQYGPRGGAYLMVLDPDQWVKKVEMAPYLDASGNMPNSIAWRYSVQMAAGDAPPRYTARLGPIQDSPYEAAEVYRDWASKQAWFPKPLSQRKDIGSWRLRGVPHYFIYLPESGPNTFKKPPKEMSAAEIAEHQKMHQGRFQLAEVPAVMDALPKEITELGGVVDLRGWEKWGLWMNPDWWPPRQGEAVLRQAIGAIRKAGLHVTTDVMFNELSIHRPKEDHGGFGEEGLRAIKARGIVLEDAVVRNEKGEAPWVGPPAYRCNYACPTVPAIFNDVVWTLSRMKEAGFDDVQFDGGGYLITQPCWNSKHSHAQGHGHWQTGMARDYYDRVRDAIPGSRESGFGFFEEYFNELRLHSYVAVYTRCEQELMRDGTTRALDRFADRRMTPLPGMFSFVYHDRMIETGFFWAHGPVAYQAAASMALGVCAGPQTTPWLTFRSILESPWMKVFIAGTKARETFAQKHLLLGQMLRPIRVEPWVTLKIGLRDAARGQWKQNDVQAPAIIQQAYRAPDGKIGWVLVNHTDQSQTCVAQPPLPPWFSELATAQTLRRVTVSGITRLASPNLRRFDLAPTEVVLLEQE
ncbi:MAG: DUF6259 domain-containing protein [Verrucomicrobia bacterium]|nr:DUF6259 domain-containing protein [Verrucomicrobiota bacterium]